MGLTIMPAAADPIHISPLNQGLSPPNSPSTTQTSTQVDVHENAGHGTRGKDVLTPPQTPRATYGWDKLLLAYSDDDDDYPYVSQLGAPRPNFGLGIDLELNGSGSQSAAGHDKARGRNELYLGYQPDDLILPRTSPRGCTGHLVLDLTTFSHGKAVYSTFHTIAHPRSSWEELMAEVERVVEGPPAAGKVCRDNLSERDCARKPRKIWVGLRTGSGHGEGEGLDGQQWEMVWRDVEAVEVRVEVESLKEEAVMELEEFADMEW
ncbi:hypothetical protein YB2330_004446 [Saitoella coloradoensis]